MAAIYQWHVANITYTIVNTTLYPVEAIDAMVMSIAILEGNMLEIPLSEGTIAHGMEDGTYIQVIWRYEDGPYDSYADIEHGMVDSTYIQVIWRYEDGPYDSYADITHGMIDGTFVNKRVEADSPDEGLDFTISIADTSTMDSV